MSTQNEIRQSITNQIIKAIESGNLPPWRRPWAVSKNTGRPTSVASGNPYTGINPLLLELHARKHGCRSKFFGTFDQWRKLGCVVKKRPAHVEPGEWGCKIVFYKPVTKTSVDQDTGEEVEDKFCILRQFVVFNADQVEGAEKYQIVEVETTIEFEPDYEPAEELIATTGATITHHGDQAFYRRPSPEGSFPNHTDGDFIVVPHKSSFSRLGSYYETVLHELAHWSEVRLNWDQKQHGYAMGELVAEIAACQLSAELGIENGEELSNHAAYLQSWLKGMRSDPSFIFKASTQASKVTDFLLSFSVVPQPAHA